MSKTASAFRIAAATGFLAWALAAWCCVPGSPLGPPGGTAGSVNYRGTFSATNYPPTTLDATLTTSGSGTAVTGAYSTANGITGEVQGTLAGTLDSGTFNGTLTYLTSPLGGTNCAGTGTFSGTVDGTRGINWTSAGFRSNCPGDPTGISVQAPPGGNGPSSSPAPIIGTFTASPATVTTGQSATLSWSGIANATTCSISNSVGTVACTNGTATVSPGTTTTYTLTATGAGGTTTAAAIVTVTAAAVACSYSLSQSQQNSVPASGQTFTFTLSRASGTCGWTAAADSWISLSPSSGRDPATITATVATNSGSARDGTVTISWTSPTQGAQSAKLTVTQDGTRTFSHCDFNQDGVVDNADVQLVANAALGGSNDPKYDLNRDGVITVADVQIEVNVSLGIAACPL